MESVYTTYLSVIRQACCSSADADADADAAPLPAAVVSSAF